MDAAWLRERADAISEAGGPDSNAKAAALYEAADVLEPPAENAVDVPAASAEAAP